MRLACTGRALQLSGLASVSRNCSGGQCSSFPPHFVRVDDSLCGFASFDVRTEKGTESMIPMAISLGWDVVFATVITLILVLFNTLILGDLKRLFRA